MKMTIALIAFLLFLPSCENIRGISVQGRYGDYSIDRDGVVTVTPKISQGDKPILILGDK